MSKTLREHDRAVSLSMSRRRPRPVGSEEDDEEEGSRSSTPSSVAPNDSKRARRSPRCEASTPNNMLGPRHRPGAIVRVKLTDFVTYTSAEFFPGPNLNMVIGPNGTGKSTLVCAICLGLGWGTQHLGRAKDTSEYVKHGCREATIEIELQSKPGRNHENPIITRLIKREGNKSVYTINGRPSSAKLVQELARSFNIQIDNLCQFLPQDKVVEFAAMSPVELLGSTQRAAAPPQMLEWHENLKQLRAHQKDELNKNSGDKEQLANLENRQEMQRADVGRLRQRAEIKRRLGWLERSRPLLRYSDALGKAREAKKRREQLSAELKQLKAESTPALKRVNAKQQYEIQVRSLKQQQKRALEDGEKKAEKLGKKLEDFEEKMVECDNMVEAELRGGRKNKEELKRVQGNIHRLKKQMEEEPEAFDARAINDQVQIKVGRQRQIYSQARDFKDQVEELQRRAHERLTDIREAKRRLEGLETQTGRQENKLQADSRDTYHVWQWIQHNQGQFEQHVYGPPMVECSLKDPKYAAAMESLFQDSDFRVITCQNQNDFNAVQAYVRRTGLHDVSLRVCSIDSLDGFRAPLSPERLRELGLESWALDCINGPSTVLAMLCNQKSLHQTAISPRDISDAQYKRLEDSGITTFVAGKVSYRFIRRREYGAAGNSAQARPIRDPKIWTNQPVDTSAKQNLQREINEKNEELQVIKEEMDALRAQKEQYQSEVKELGGEIEALKQDKEQKQKALAAFRALPAKLEQQEEKLAQIEENLSALRQRVDNIKSGKDTVLFGKAEATLQYIAAVFGLRKLYGDLLATEVLHIEAQSDFATLRERNEHILAMLQRKGDEEKEAATLAGQQLAKAKELLIHVQTLSDEGRRMRQQGDPGLHDLLQELSANKCTIEDLEADIDSEKAKLELTHGGSSNIIAEFEDRQRRIDLLRESVEASKRKQDDFKHGIEEIRGRWEPELEKLVAKISDAFADSFTRIGCAGQVEVHKASSNDNESDPQRTVEAEDADGNGLDFANWAIHISVKFRDAEPLSLLDSHRQSGGERAVSTIFYLMALQSLSRAPFRVVDEINQGMDPRNERMVHGRMVDLACGRTVPPTTSANGDGEIEDHVETTTTTTTTTTEGSQYFLITPKLLSGLRYKRGMTVLCIVSGENMPGPAEAEGGDQTRTVDFAAWCRRARELGMGTGMGMGMAEGRPQGWRGQRVDSGVAMGGTVQEVGA